MLKPYSRRVIKSEEVAYRTLPAGQEIATGRNGAAEADMARLKASLTREVQLARQQAYAEGLAEGIEKGRALHQQEQRQTIDSLTALLAEAAGIRQALLAEAEGQILDLALAVAEKVIHREVTTNREVIQGVLREAIRQIADRSGMKIRIHPQDFRYMMEIKSDFLQTIDGIGNVVFEADDGIARGGALIETLYGEVDARIDQQFREVRGALTTPPGQGAAPR